MTAKKRSTKQKHTMPMLPLRGLLVFPHMVTSFEVGRERSLSALEAAMIQDVHNILLVAQRNAGISEPEPEDIYEVGTVAEIKQVLTLPENRLRVLVEGKHRVEVAEFAEYEPQYTVVVHPLEEQIEPGPETEALMRATLRQFDEYLKLSKKGSSDTLAGVAEISSPTVLSYTIAAQITVSIEEKQDLLETIATGDRLEKICAILARECEILQIEQRIQSRVRKQMEKTQREYYLREQIKAIRQELGEKDERSAEVEEFRARVKEAKLPQEAKKKVEHELLRLEKMPPMAAEAVVVRNYLEWVLSLPWAKKTRDRLDLKEAERILERDHYGLASVKERILEFLAVRQLAKKIKGPILCLVGPPGVGKTSLARSVAEALGRKFHRFSLGGVRDEAEIRGHRRTYVGAMPGKIVQSLRTAGTRNPLILLDEIDKMSADFRGDPSAALLEVLDPEQNNHFGDHYLELEFDLSDVMFITTANVLYDIPGPLRDRMELITIPGYTEDEKIEIAKRHLLPKQLETHGLKADQLIISDQVVQEVIGGYTREAGVRSLERSLAALCRKAAREIVSGNKDGVRINTRSLPRYLGQPRFTHTEVEEGDRVGVATGLAYTQTGGDILHVEVSVVEGKGRLTLTGKLGEVMRESAQAAFSYIRTCAKDFGIDPAFHEKYDLHVHVPEGAIPKEGPSAGITIATALASALSGRVVTGGWAMTGEITLRGRVLPVGGIKEKVLAAHRAGVRSVILPQGNKKDLDEIPASTRRRLKVELVEHMDQVLEKVLAPLRTETEPEPGREMTKGMPEPMPGWNKETEHEPATPH